MSFIHLNQTMNTDLSRTTLDQGCTGHGAGPTEAIPPVAPSTGDADAFSSALAQDGPVQEEDIDALATDKGKKSKKGNRKDKTGEGEEQAGLDIKKQKSKKEKKGKKDKKSKKEKEDNTTPEGPSFEDAPDVLSDVIDSLFDSLADIGAPQFNAPPQTPEPLPPGPVAISEPSPETDTNPEVLPGPVSGPITIPDPRSTS